jgi:hypothetical protein
VSRRLTISLIIDETAKIPLGTKANQAATEDFELFNRGIIIRNMIKPADPRHRPSASLSQGPTQDFAGS